MIFIIPGHSGDEKVLQRQEGVGAVVCIPGMKSASRPGGEPVVNRGFCSSAGLNRNSFVRACAGTFSEFSLLGKTEVPRMQSSSS